jgi:hypothetical protein
MTPTQFCNRHGITADSEYADPTPDQDEQWSRDASHWRVTLKRGRKRMTTPYSMGSAHTGEPKAADVLWCLVQDAHSYDNASSFEEWCGDYGYDTDSRKAERIYTAVKRSAAKVKQFLGPDLYEQSARIEE